MRLPALMLIATAATLAACSHVSLNPRDGLGVFVTSVGSGKGGDLGGLAGADAHCQKLAAAAGAGGRSWRAYLSTQPAAGQPGINARDRIGPGPWRNAKGEVVAQNVAELHETGGRMGKTIALTETGAVVNGRGDTPNLHDMLTGSRPDGSFDPSPENSTCSNWTQSAGGSAWVGHHDRTGLDDSVAAKSWNSSHKSRGCGPDELKTTGGAGLFYCFAAD